MTVGKDTERQAAMQALSALKGERSAADLNGLAKDYFGTKSKDELEAIIRKPLPPRHTPAKE